MSGKVLVALDASSPEVSMACLSPDGERQVIPLEKKIRHNTELIASLDTFFRRMGWQPGMLSGLALNLGPGSFTGLRSACAVAQALSLARPDIALHGVPHADVWRQWATEHHAGEAVLAVMAWKRDDAWTQAWDRQGGCVLAAADRSVSDVFRQLPQEGRVVGDVPRSWRGATEALPEGWVYEPSVTTALDVLAAVVAEPERWLLPPEKMLPVYPREAEAVTLWRERHG